MLTKEQKERRKSYLGGTDIAAILGVDSLGERIDPFKTALDVYMEKKGEVAPFEGNIHTLAGTIFEKGILEFYEAQEDSVPLQKLKDSELELTHPLHPFLIGHPDAIDENGGIIEVKNIGFRSSFKWGDPTELELPRNYLVQACYYMALRNWDGVIRSPYAKIVPFFGGSELKIYTVPYSENKCKSILTQAVNFWNNHIISSVPPSPLTYSEIADYFKAIEGTPKEASEEIIEAVNSYKWVKMALDKAEKEMDNIKCKIGIFLGDADTLMDKAGNKLLTFKEQITKRLDTKKIREDGLYDQYSTESAMRIMRFSKLGDK